MINQTDAAYKGLKASLNKQVEQFSCWQKNLQKSLSAFFQNKSIPLDYRWDFWLTVNLALKKSEFYISENSALGNFFNHDGDAEFVLSEYSEYDNLVVVQDFISYLEENYLKDNDNNPSYWSESIRELKEATLKDNIFSFWKL